MKQTESRGRTERRLKVARVGTHPRAPSPPARDRHRAMANAETLEESLRRILTDSKWANESAGEPRLLSARYSESTSLGFMCPIRKRLRGISFPRGAPRLCRGSDYCAGH